MERVNIRLQVMKKNILTICLAICIVKNATAQKKDNSIAINKDITRLSINSSLSDSLHILYLGCNNVLIKYKEDAIMFDPFFSNQSLPKILFKHIQFDTAAISLGLNRIKEAGFNLKKIEHIFITHSHYDHVFDLPYLLTHKYLKENTKIHGSVSLQTELDTFKKAVNFITNITHPCDTNVYDTSLWQYLLPNFRVLPLLSKHAPHFLGIEFMKGDAKKKKFKNIDTSTFYSRAKHWKVGTDYAYLIDIIEAGKPVFRMLMQGPSVFPCENVFPDVVLKEKNVDIAMMVIASNQFIKKYPTYQLARLKPKKVIVIHWENFFKKYTKQASLLPGTNHKIFFKKAAKAKSATWNYQNNSDMFIMPYPGNKIVLK